MDHHQIVVDPLSPDHLAARERLRFEELQVHIDGS